VSSIFCVVVGLGFVFVGGRESRDIVIYWMDDGGRMRDLDLQRPKKKNWNVPHYRGGFFSPLGYLISPDRYRNTCRVRIFRRCFGLVLRRGH
jgi:hypothetical protein